MGEVGRLYELATKLVAQQVEIDHAVDWLVESAGGNAAVLDSARQWANSALHNGWRDQSAARIYILLQEACARVAELRKAAGVDCSTRLAALWRSVDGSSFGEALYRELDGARNPAKDDEAPTKRLWRR